MENNLNIYCKIKQLILRFPLVFVYPQLGTFRSEHPYCVLDTDWVTETEREAGMIFGEYLRASEQQELAMAHYLRPTDPSISLVAPFTLENGTNPAITTDIVPVMEAPSAGVASDYSQPTSSWRLSAPRIASGSRKST